MSHSRFWFGLALVAVVLNLAHFRTLSAADPSDESGTMATKAIGYLTAHQGEDGSFSPQTGPAVTAMVVAATLNSGRTPDDPLVAKGLTFLEKFVQEDGGIYQKDTFHKNYETCISLMAFSAANRNGKYDALLKKAEAFVKDIQFDSGEEKTKADLEYGGAGYGRHKRPDLSNTSFFLDALKSVGNDENSDAIQRALVFVSRCQNLESEYNSTPFPAKNPDGGFYYTPAGETGNSQAGNTENGGLRSYASMTYAGLKSMLYAGLKPDDARVKAAISWLKKNYTLKQNPGMDQQGLYYYYHTMARALKTLGQDEFVEDNGTKHDWRKEIIAELKSRQKEDGSWVNEQPRWMEGDANLVTAYALMTLAQCKK